MGDNCNLSEKVFIADALTIIPAPCADIRLSVLQAAAADRLPNGSAERCGSEHSQCSTMHQAYLDSCAARQVKPNSKAQVAFSSCSTASHMSFASAHLGDRGILPVLLVLAPMPCLTHVDFSRCALHTASIEAVADFIRFHPAIPIVDLRGNSFSPTAAPPLVSALEFRRQVAGAAEQPPPVELLLACTGIAPQRGSAPLTAGGTFLRDRPKWQGLSVDVDLQKRLVALGAQLQ